MGIRDKGVLSRVRKHLRELEARLEKEVLIVLSEKGDAWISDSARDVISVKGIKEDDLLGWLKQGARHLSETRYLDLDIMIIRFPGSSGDVLCILREGEPGQRTYQLTPKEREILGHSIRGLTNKEIAACLNISPGTVNTHLDSIYRKLGVSNRIEASFVALKNGLIVPSDH